MQNCIIALKFKAFQSEHMHGISP